MGKISGVDLGTPKIVLFLGEKLLKRGQKAIKIINKLIFLKFLVSKTFLIGQKLSKNLFKMTLLIIIWVGGTVDF